jgi:hypothetical protein
MVHVGGVEFVHQLIDELLFVGLEGSFHYVIHAVSHPRDDGCELGNRPGVQLKDMVDRFRNVTARIDKRSIQVEQIEVEHRYSPLQVVW